MPQLKVLTLNCWGVPFPIICQLRKDRFEAIGDEVAKSDYDIVCLEEVWHKGDYEILKKKICEKLPYTHYFYSGMLGSGLCVFSSIPILETFYHRYDLNGYVHKLQHGDWFGGKGVGLCKLQYEGMSINLYVTHIHAEYNRVSDEYLAHRVSQAFQLSQFVRYTAQTADVTIVCGDFNLESVDLGYKLIRTNAKLKDCWIEKKSTVSDLDGNTCDCPTNSFVDEKSLKLFPKGKRIDYIMYGHDPAYSLTIKECSLAMGKVPNKPFNFSDHEGVMAVISVNRLDPKDRHPKSPADGLDQLLQEGVTVINKGIKKAQSDNRFFILLAIICLVLLYLISIIHIPYPVDYFTTFFKLALTLSVGFAVINNFILVRAEVHGLQAANDDMKNVIRTLGSKQ